MTVKHYKCKFEKKIIEICENVASIKATGEATRREINGNLKAFQRHVDHGVRWRVGILIISATLVISIAGAIYSYGKIAQTVKHHDKIIMTVIKEN